MSEKEKLPSVSIVTIAGYQTEHNNNSREMSFPGVPQVKLNWFELVQKNKPQANSVGAAFMYLMCSGLHLCWGIFRQTQFGEWNTGTTNPWGVVMAIVTWFIAANIGGGISILLMRRFKEKIIYYICGVILIVSSLLLVIWYNQLAAIIVARILAGFVHGIIHPLYLVRGAENSVKEIRGYLMTSGSYVLWIMICLGAVYFGIIMYGAIQQNEYNRFLTPEFLMGISVMFFAALGLIMTPCLTYESVVKLISQGREDKAIKNMMKLRNESVETWAIRNEFNDLRLMVQEDSLDGDSVFTDGNLRPFLILLAAKLMQTLAMIWPLNYTGITYTSVLLLSSPYVLLYNAAIMVSGTFITMLIALYTVDRVGRKKSIIISGVICSVALIIVGFVLVGTQLNVTYWFPGAMFIIFYAAAGFGVFPVPEVMMSEAFGTKKKLRSIVLIHSIMNIIHIISIVPKFHTVFTFAGSNAVILVVGFTIAIGTALMVKFMPETRMMSLRQSRNEYRKQGVMYSNGQNITGITYT